MQLARSVGPKIWAGAALAMLIAAVPARAALVLTITIDGGPPLPGSTTVVTDNGGNDSDPVAGQIAYLDLSTPQFTGTVHILTSNSPGDVTGGILQLDSQLNAVLGGSISITASDTGFTAPPPGIDLLSTTATLTSFDPVAGTFQGSANSTTTGPKALLGPSDSNFDTAPFSYAGSYGLSSSISLPSVPAGEAMNVGETVTVTPEPGAVALAGIAVTAMLSRRRRA